MQLKLIIIALLTASFTPECMSQKPYFKTPVLLYDFANETIVGGDVEDLDGDGLSDILVATALHQTPAFLKNTGTKEQPLFTTRLNQPFQLGYPDVYDELVLEASPDPAFPVMDVFFYKVFENRLRCAVAIGTPTSPKYAKPSTPNPFGLTLPVAASGRVCPSFVDVNLDGYRDCIMSYWGGNNNRWTWVFFRNKTNAAGYTLDGLNGVGLLSPAETTSAFRFCDFDLDGDQDAFYVETDQPDKTWKLFYAENVMNTTDNVIKFGPPATNPFGVDMTGLTPPSFQMGADYIRIDTKDMDSDGDDDLIVFLQHNGDIFLIESLVAVSQVPTFNLSASSSSAIDGSFIVPGGNLVSFAILRSTSPDGPFEEVNRIDAANSKEGETITFTDEALEGSTTYYYKIMSANAYTSKSSIVQSATTEKGEAPPVEVATLFTPNGDGVNDTWNVAKFFAAVGKFTVRIFNRNGKEVFKATQDDQSGWDGTYKGRILPEGTYSYTVDVDQGDKVKGFITLLRN